MTSPYLCKLITSNNFIELSTSYSFLVVIAFFTSTHNAWADEEVNVYSYRQPFLVNPLFDEFTKETGIKVNVVFAKKGMAERLKREGEYSPADVLLTTDISRLIELQDKGLLQAATSAEMTAAIPAAR